MEQTRRARRGYVRDAARHQLLARPSAAINSGRFSNVRGLPTWAAGVDTCDGSQLATSAARVGDLAPRHLSRARIPGPGASPTGAIIPPTRNVSSTLRLQSDAATRKYAGDEHTRLAGPLTSSTDSGR
jgi:hypothetical protein